MTRQSGFTLIELITVIVILGILSAFALPRFAGLEANARAASLQGLAGSVRSGAALAHSVWLAVGTKPATIAMEGANVTMDTITGYPDDINAGIRNVISDVSGYSAAAIGGGAAGYIFGMTGIATANCNVTYLLGTTAGTPPTVTIRTTACQ